MQTGGEVKWLEAPEANMTKEQSKVKSPVTLLGLCL